MSEVKENGYFSNSDLQHELQNAQDYIQQKRVAAHRDYVKPLSKQYYAAAHRMPLVTTYMTIFMALSLVPLSLFAAFAAVVTVSLAGTALFFVLSTMGVVIGAALFFLVGTLLVIGFISLLGTSWLVGAFLAYRLWIQIRSHSTLGEGLHQFSNELKGYAGSTVKEAQHINGIALDAKAKAT